MPDLLQTFDELKDKVIIVEGKHDEQALRSFGVDHIIPINSRPLVTVVQGIADGKEVVILTDFDKQGRKLHARLMSLLQKHRIRTNRRLRHMVKEYGRTRIEDFNRLAAIEGFDAPTIYKRGDSHGETRAHVNQIRHQGENQRKRGYRKTRRYWGSVRADGRPARD